jgi:hypothetical protein
MPPFINRASCEIVKIGTTDFSSAHYLNSDYALVNLSGSDCKVLPNQKARSYFPVNQKVYFNSSDQDSREFLGKGWSFAEEWGTWSVQQKAEINFSIGKSDNLISELILDLRSFIPNSDRTQIVTIFVNNQKVKSVAFASNWIPQEVMIPVPSSFSTRRDHTIIIMVESLNNPKTFGINSDDRPLGVGLNWMILSAIDD